MTTERSADPLLDILLGFLTPLLMTGGITDPGLAGLAAQQAIAAARTEAGRPSRGHRPDNRLRTRRARQSAAVSLP